MRTIELALVMLLGLRLVLGLKWDSRWLDWFSVAILGVCLMHLGQEGYRWQMILVYAMVVGLVVISIRRLRGRGGRGQPLRGRVVLGICLLAVATAAPILVPVPETREPSGAYGIGTVTVMLVDQSREEIYAQPPGGARRLMVQVWYPVDKGVVMEKSPWIQDVEVIAPAIARFLELPGFSLNHLRYVYSHAQLEAPLSEAENQYPLLLFSHGWNGFRAQNTFQVEELVSHGYVVAAPDHTYGSVATVFPDGEVTLVNREALPMRGSLPPEERLETVRILGQVWAGDLSFIADSLLAAKAEDGLEAFSGKIDPERVGAFGHSTGGGAVIQFCGADARCKITLAMDPYMEPVASAVLEDGLEVPLMAMFSEGRQDRDDNLDYFARLKENSSGEVIQFEILGTRHFDFSDLPGVSPLAPVLGLKGKIDGDRVVALIKDYTLAFFDRTFKGVGSELLEGEVEAYPEVVWGE